MKNFTLLAALVVLLTTMVSCDAINTIFEAGKIWGIIVAVVVIGIVLFLFRMLSGRK